MMDILQDINSRVPLPPYGEGVLLDGLEVCPTCGRARQKRINWQGREMLVNCLCDCQAAEVERKRAQEEERERLLRVQRVRDLSMMPGRYKDARFDICETWPENRRVLDVARKYAGHFGEMEQRAQGLLLFGPVGTGKSYTAACIANALMDKEVSVIMTSTIRILDAKNADDVNAAIRDARLLILDDLGAERDTDYAIERVYQLIDDRVRSERPMIVTTNVRMSDMVNEMDLRKKRIYDRILETCYPVEVGGRSRRLTHGAQRQKEMRAFFEGGE